MCFHNNTQMRYKLDLYFSQLYKTEFKLNYYTMLE